MKHLPLVFLSIILCNACNTTTSIAPKARITGSTLGTTYQVIYYANIDPNTVYDAMDDIFEDINASMSTYQDNSIISKLNAGDTTIIVDNMFADVFTLSKDIYKKSNGFFDPTVGNLVNAYGFGSKQFTKDIDSLVIDSLHQYVGLNTVSLTANNQIKKQYSETYLDFNAIAKGYCIDKMASYLNSKGVEHYLIELGGELVARGNKLNQTNAEITETPWIAGIEEPNEDGTRRVSKKVSLVNRAMATSGNYRKFRRDKITGKRYVHTINPKTGYPEKNDLLSATVFAKTCAEADAWATAFMAMGIENAMLVLEDLNTIDVHFMYINTDGHFETYTSQGIETIED